jgi:phage terminase small subunit
MTRAEGPARQERAPTFNLDPDRPLTRQERRFVQVYVETSNPHQARQAAGFRRVSARNLLGRPAVQKALAEARRAAAQETLPGSIIAHLRELAVLRELKAIGFADITDFAIDPVSGKVYSLSGDPDATRAVMHFERKVRRKVVGADETGNPMVKVEEVVTIKLWDKNEALALLAKSVGLPDAPAPSRTYVRFEQACGG